MRSAAGSLFRSGDIGETYEDIISRRPEVSGGERGFAKIVEVSGSPLGMEFVPMIADPDPEPSRQLSLF